MLTLKR